MMQVQHKKILCLTCNNYIYCSPHGGYCEEKDSYFLLNEFAECSLYKKVNYKSVSKNTTEIPHKAIYKPVYKAVYDINSFISNFSLCPVCKAKLSVAALKKIFTTNIELRNLLINSSKDANKLRTNIKIGIPCCKCYRKYLRKRKD